MHQLLCRGLGLSLAGLTLSLYSTPALACGGTFCDAGPQPMPVDQTGENILFVMDGEYVEAHVQIQYDGEAERFAWVVPIQAPPEVTVGSQPLFDSLLGFSVPTYFTATQFETCGTTDGGGFGGTTVTTTSGTSTTGASSTGGVQILFEETVGSFDVTVLESGDATEVTNWLIENDYELAEEAPAILAEYVNLNHVFAAIKLTAGADVEEIHPLVFRYAGDEPCVPLKLTAVAAKDDMAVRAFFLGEDRVYPSNYMHVEFNPVRLDWVANGSNYTNVVSRAVDEEVADGHAFVTEYAGPSAGVPTTNVYSNAWDADGLRVLSAGQILAELNAQGVISCNTFQCSFTHPLVLPLLREHLPAPDGWTSDVDFYACLATNGQSTTTTGGTDDTCIVEADQLQFDANAFADAYDEQIVQPGQHAADLIDQWPYLTRLFMTISPDEMTVDPMFHARAELTLGVSQSRQAVQLLQCSGDRTVTLPDGRVVALDGTTWPAFSSAMPWVERIEEVPAEGDVIVLVDNTEIIDEQLDAWNALSGVNVEPGEGLAGSGGTGGSASGSNSTDASGGTSSGGASSGGSNGGNPNGSGGGAGADSGDEDEDEDEQLDPLANDGGGSCSCRIPGGTPRGNALLLASLLGAAVVVNRRRRTRRQYQ